MFMIYIIKLALAKMQASASIAALSSTVFSPMTKRANNICRRADQERRNRLRLAVASQLKSLV